MFEHYESTAEFGLIEAIAAALREELGPSMEDQPGGHLGEATAGQVNRAFRVVARCILRTVAPPDEDLADLLNWALDRLTRRRLAAGGLDRGEVEHLIVREADGRDDGLAFLALTTWDEVEVLLRSRDPGR